jgi:hypothetical protein
MNVIEDALQASLRHRENVGMRRRVRIITIHGTGTWPGITLDHRHALLENMEQ